MLLRKWTINTVEVGRQPVMMRMMEIRSLASQSDSTTPPQSPKPPTFLPRSNSGFPANAPRAPPPSPPPPSSSYQNPSRWRSSPERPMSRPRPPFPRRPGPPLTAAELRDRGGYSKVSPLQEILEHAKDAAKPRPERTEPPVKTMEEALVLARRILYGDEFANAAATRAAKRKEVLASAQLHPMDVGSSQAQVAILSTRISAMTEHLRVNRKDKHSLRGLQMMLSLRRKLMKYLSRKDPREHDRIAAMFNIKQPVTTTAERRELVKIAIRSKQDKIRATAITKRKKKRR